MNVTGEYDELDLLLIDLFESGLDPVRLNELSALLAKDPQARRRYIDRSTIHALLEWQAGRVDWSMHRSLPLSTPGDLSHAMILPAITDSEPEQDEQDGTRPIETAPPLAVESVRGPRGRQPASRGRWLWFLSVAAAILVLVSVSVVMLRSRRPSHSVQVALLKNAGSAQWEPGFAPRSADGAIVRNEQLSLLSGSVEMVFGEGASVVIQAPAQFSASTSNTMTFTSGRMAALVPEPARGFTVTTPELVVKDLGTEFGISCGQEVQTEVDVFKGTVEAKSRSDPGSSPVRLIAGDAVTISSGALGPVSGTADQGKFPRLAAEIVIPPRAFSDADIGASATPGSSHLDVPAATWTIDGAGVKALTAKDQFHFVSKTVDGDATITCRVATPPTASTGLRRRLSRAGIMFRKSLDPGSVCVEVVLTESQGVQMISRDAEAGNPEVVGPPAIFNRAPIWLRLTRAGDAFTGAYSHDGLNWTNITSHVLGLPPVALAGLVVSSGDAKQAGTATFTDFSISGGTAEK